MEARSRRRLIAQIATEENRTRIKDTGYPVYSSFTKATAKVAHMKSMLEVAKHELDEVAMQFRDLEF